MKEAVWTSMRRIGEGGARVCGGIEVYGCVQAEVIVWGNAPCSPNG